MHNICFPPKPTWMKKSKSSPSMAFYPKKNNDSFLFKSERPHFFKIILDHQQNKLSIPRKFARNYGHHLSNPVIMKIPSGATWSLDVVRSSDGEIWLQNGWQEFVDYYSISYGSFLVFEYDTNNGVFNVTIFDKTATEIDYPFTFSNGDNERAHYLDQEQDVPNVVHVDEAEDDDDISVEILDHFSPSRRTNAKSLPSSSTPDKKINPETRGKELNPQFPTDGVEGNRNQAAEKKRNKKQNLSFSNPPRAKGAAKKLSPANPCFQARISPDCLKRRRVFVPKSFVKSMVQGTKATMLELNDRFWPVKLATYNYRVRGTFSAGWDAFATDNSLKLGDICSFEMINNSNQTLLIKVLIMRGSSTFLASNGDNEMPESQVHTVGIPSKREDRLPLSSSWPHTNRKKVDDFSDITDKGTNAEEKKHLKEHIPKPLYSTAKRFSLRNSPKPETLYGRLC